MFAVNPNTAEAIVTVAPNATPKTKANISTKSGRKGKATHPATVNQTNGSTQRANPAAKIVNDTPPQTEEKSGIFGEALEGTGIESKRPRRNNYQITHLEQINYE